MTDVDDQEHLANLANLSNVALDDLRARRRELQALDDAVSFARRIAQGRLDLVRAEQHARAAPTERPDLTDGLRDVLADRLLSASARPPRPIEDHSEHPLVADLDRLSADHGFGRFAELDDVDLAGLVGALDGFEQQISKQRRAVYTELDALTDELVRRLSPPAGDP